MLLPQCSCLKVALARLAARLSRWSYSPFGLISKKITGPVQGFDGASYFNSQA